MLGRASVLGLALCAVCFLAACSVAPVKKPYAPSPPAAGVSLKRIKAMPQKTPSQKRHKMERLRLFLEAHPATLEGERAAIALGQLYYDQNQYFKAFSTVAGWIDSPHAVGVDVYALALESLHKLKRFEELLVLLDKMQNQYSQELPLELLDLGYESARAAGALVKAAQLASSMMSRVAAKASGGASGGNKYIYRMRVLDVMRLASFDELLEIYALREDAFLHAQAALALGERELKNQNFKKAQRYLNKLINSKNVLPDQVYLAKELLQKIAYRSHVDPKVIGVVLAFSGEQSQEISERVLRGLQLGLGIGTQQDRGFRLVVGNTGADPGQAKEAFERVVLEDSAIAVVGDLLSVTSEPIADLAQSFGVPNVSLSQKNLLARAGDYVFQSALTAEYQSRFLARMAFEQLGFRRLGILAPDDAYGQSYALAFKEHFEALGGKVVVEELYPSGATDFSEPVGRLVNVFDAKDRMPEYRALWKEWKQANKNPRARFGAPHEVLEPQVEFEALFVPDAARAVGQIVPTLKLYSVKDIDLLGVNLWNNEEFVRRTQGFGGNSYFVDIGVWPEIKAGAKEFVKLFRKHFAYDPGLFEMRAFDVGRVLWHLVGENNLKTREAVQKALLGVKDFAGSLGMLSCDEHRGLNPPLVGLSLRENQVVRLDTLNGN